MKLFLCRNSVTFLFVLGVCFFFIFAQANLFLIEAELLHYIVLVSTIHDHESAIGIHVSPPV